MNHNWKRMLSIVLSVALVFSMLVPMVSAEGRDTDKLQRIELEPVDASTLGLFQENTVAEDKVAQEEYKLTDVLRVSIVLEKASTVEVGFGLENIARNAAAKSYREGLKAEQAAMTARIEAATGKTLDVKWNITLAGNMISANVLYADLETIRAIPGVKDVIIENRYELDEAMKMADEPDMGTSTVQTGSTAAWAAGYTGAGSKVAIIDTGVAWDHQSFDPDALLYAYEQDGLDTALLMTADDVAAVSDQLNSGVGAEAYINAKVPYGYCYVDSDFDVTHENDTQGSHGSHVAGISAANRYITDGAGGYVSALTEIGVQGVAPDAQLVAMKVFGNGGGAYDSDYMAAIEDAIVLGCDSANLSLGSGQAGLTFSEGYQDIMDSLLEHGMVVAMSAGNSYSWYDTPYNDDMYGYLYMGDVNYATNGSPGSFANSLTVASVNNSGQIGMPIMFGNLWVFYNETSGYGNAPIASIAELGELEYVFVNSTGVHTVTDDPDEEANDNVGKEGDDFWALGEDVVRGKVAICWRGTSSFFAKANAAVAQGAVAVIVANNQAGGINMDLTGYEFNAPCVSIYQADGQAILAQSTPVDVNEDGKADYYTGTLSISESLSLKLGEETNVQTMSDFSSWGTAGSLMLKPEITAPGGSIYSVVGHNYEGGSESGGTDTYETWSGTSMASPQVAGMAAVLGQYIRENELEAQTGLSERQLINSLLMSTAVPLVDDYGDYWSILKQGAGMANVGKAVEANSYILMDEESTMFPSSARDGKVKAELGDDPEKTGVYCYSFTINPLNDAVKEYNLSTDLFIQWIAGNAGYAILQDEATAQLTEGEDFYAYYFVDGEFYTPYYTVEADVDQDGDTDAADAQAILDYVTGENDGTELDLTAADVDGDGDVTTADARQILDAASTATIVVEDQPVSVEVYLLLDPNMADFIDNYFGQTYIEGFTYLEGLSTGEGEIVDVTHSIPILAFYGSWTDATMFDHTSVIDELYGTGNLPYMADTNINYMTVKDAEGASVVYTGNPYTVEDEFPADRLAVNGEHAIAGFNYMPIRNIGTLAFVVTDAEGKVIGTSSINGNVYAPYYYVNGGAWRNTGSRSFSVNKTLKSMGVQEGETVTIGLYALPEYYAVQVAKENGTVDEMESGVLDAEGLKAVVESGVLGEGASISYTVTVDNTAPEVEGMFLDLISGNVLVKAQDNQYIAYVGVLNKSGTVEYLGVVPEQSEPGEAVEVTLDLSSVTLPANALLVVGDYAGNTYAAKFSTGSNAQANDLGGLILAASSAAYAPGSGNRWIELDPAALYYNTDTGAYDGMSVYSNSGVAVRAAEYVEGYVFIATADGGLYAAAISELDDPQKVGSYSDTVDLIYDMAYNYVDGQLYVLGSDNVIYTMDLTTGKLTPAVILTLNGVSGSNAVANKLAIDDNGTFYVANYGNTSSAKLFKFKLAAADAGETEPEDLTLIYGNDFDSEDAVAEFTLIDADGDGNNWAWDSSTNIASASYVGGAGVNPDNWAVSPAIDLSEDTEATFSISARNVLGSYPETLALYAGTSAEIADMTKLTDDFQPAGSLTTYTADLSAFAGESAVYVAIRHYNSFDQYRVVVDTVEVRRPEVEPEPVEEPEPEPEEITAEAVGVMGVYNYNYGGALAWDHNTKTLYLAANYNATRDYDHDLWTVNTSNGKAERVNSIDSSNYYATFGICLNGLIIVPGKGAAVTPASEATGVEALPEDMNLLRGMTGVITANVFPWTLEDKDVTFESADTSIATVNAKGEVKAVAVGETDVTVTTVAAPNLTATVHVTVEEPPVAELRGIVWNEEGKGMASVFSTDATNEWEGLAEVGQLRWGALVDDTVYGSTEDMMVAFDADTYELTELGGIVSDWIPGDADALPADMADAYGALVSSGHVGRVIGPSYYGNYLTMIDPESGSLIYFDLSDDFGSDPMALISYIGRGDYAEEYEDCAFYYVATESGTLYVFILTMDGYLYMEEAGSMSIDLTGTADPTNETWGSMVYDAESGFLFITLYNGSGESAVLYTVDAEDPSVCAELGDFNKDVWPVTGLYEYTPATDLSLKVNKTEVELYEGQTEQLSIKVKLGETNEFTVESSDESVATVDETGLITAVGEGAATVTVTTVDNNAAGDQISAEVAVTVKGLTSVEAFVTAQVSDESGDHFASVSLAGLAYNVKAAAPFAAYSAARTGDIYMIGTESSITALDAEDLTTEVEYPFDAFYSSYPAMDIANYPTFVGSDGSLDENKALFTTSLGWVVKPDYYGWDLSSDLPDMAGIAFAGTDPSDDSLYIYYILTTAGVLWEMDVDYAAGEIDGLYEMMDTGITLDDQGACSMAYVMDYRYDVISATLVPNAVGLVVADNATKDVWFIDFMTGEVGFCGQIDADNISGLIGSYDVLATVAEDYVPPEPPAPSENAAYTWSFETDPEADGWTFEDVDGDGNNWYMSVKSLADYAYDGQYFITSASYSSVALNPDNWAISPAVDLSGIETPSLSLYVRGQDPSWAGEHYQLYAGTTPDPTAMTAISDEMVATGEYENIVASLADFAEETEVYIAIRHFNISDMFRLNVDRVEIIDGTAPIEPETVETANKNAVPAGYEAYRLNRGGAFDGFAKANAPKIALNSEIELQYLGNPAANKVVGGTNATRGKVELQAAERDLPSEETEDEGNVLAVRLFDEDDTSNGLMTVSYDAEKLSVLSVESDLDYYSVHVDETAGTITFAYAFAGLIDAGETLATVKFAYDYDEDEGFNTTVIVETLERDDDTAVAEEPVEITLNILGAPTWDWTEELDEEENVVGYTAATATWGEGEDAVVENAVITSETTDAECEADGETVFTATVTVDGVDYTDTKTVVLPATGHDWDFAEVDDVVWAEDYSSVTVNMVCRNDPSHTTSGTSTDITVEYLEGYEPTCTEEGYVTYSAEVTVEGLELPVSVSSTEIAPALGHSYGAPTWTWAADGSLAAATFVCEHGDDEVTKTTVPMLDEITSFAPTCTETGENNYIATVSFEGATYNDTYSVTVEATGHDWSGISYVWADDYSSVTATRTCNTDASHVETETADSESEVIREATCTEDGLMRYRAVFENEAFDVAVAETAILAEGHTEAEAVRENDVAPTCTAAGSYDMVVYCADCGEELSRESYTVEALGHTEAEAVRENDVAPTCTAAGSYDMVVYCTVCGEELSRETTAIEALGHNYGDWIVLAPATCESNGIEAHYCGRCGASETRPITATGHSWGEVSYVWSYDNATVTATRICSTCGKYDVETVSATAETTNPSCTEDGQTVYTGAAFANEAFEAQTKTVVLPATGHSYGEPEWTWSKDYKSASAKFVCAEGDDEQTVEATVSSVKTGNTTVYTATVEFNGETFTDDKSVENHFIVVEPTEPTEPQQPDEPGDEDNYHFVDVQDPDSWYYNAVNWAADNGIANGIDETHFVPNGDCTRAMMVTFIWRMAGSPEPKSTECQFEDVNADDEFYKAVVWATEVGVVKGVSETLFAPERTVTRGQTVALLFRYAKAEAVTSVSNFTDVQEDDYYFDAVNWAAAKEIVKGITETLFAPKQTCKRSEIITFLYRFNQQ
ncbi:MAG: S8 family serine peptidase [Oscillospiraceae bacterium]|nr:S8 family serine peptidase [Oscillospiraceae bacterium]